MARVVTLTGLEPAQTSLKGWGPSQLAYSAMVTLTGFEPVICGLRVRCPGPLDDRAMVGAIRLERTLPCLKGRCSTIELHTRGVSRNRTYIARFGDSQDTITP